MKQTKLEIQKALAEDSTVYEYDSIYDELQKKKEESNPKLLVGRDRKPKYIHNLLKAVEIRKKEQEKRMEKKIQREREMENGEFDDKEAFVTSAYKKKLEERAEEEEKEKRAAALEARLDVTKQKDLSGFYRHLLNQAVGEEAVPQSSFREARTVIKEEKLRGYPDETNSENRPPQKNCVLQSGVEEAEENPDADSDFDDKSSEDSERGDHKVKSRGEEDTGASTKYPKHHKTHAHSRSSSEERGLGSKHHSRGSQSRGHEQKGGQHQDRQSRDQESCHRDRSHREEKSSHRHREASHKDHSWKRREGREQGERQDREWKREKYSSREQERDRQQNDEDRYSEKEKKSREKEEHRKARRERCEDSGKHREREKPEARGQASERHQDRRASSPRSRPKDDLDQERSSKARNTEKEKGEQGKPSHSETSLATKHRLAEERPEKGNEQKPPEAGSKFAKRSNEETVMSARDRYLARQMARINAKTYIEKEDD
ncbi:nuclear speckle splicing regulatory protein 1 isoform X2 [Apodemus sylvaticus]|nr:nuclear speckle splicing regulatory protein 1 isoform X2 [Apodemus sylvaticus]